MKPAPDCSAELERIAPCSAGHTVAGDAHQRPASSKPPSASPWAPARRRPRSRPRHPHRQRPSVFRRRRRRRPPLPPHRPLTRWHLAVDAAGMASAPSSTLAAAAIHVSSELLFILNLARLASADIIEAMTPGERERLETLRRLNILDRILRPAFDRPCASPGGCSAAGGHRARRRTPAAAGEGRIPTSEWSRGRPLRGLGATCRSSSATSPIRA